MKKMMESRKLIWPNVKSSHMANEQAGTSILRYREPWKDCEEEERLWEENWRKINLVEMWAQGRGKAWLGSKTAVQGLNLYYWITIPFSGDGFHLSTGNWNKAPKQ